MITPIVEMTTLVFTSLVWFQQEEKHDNARWFDPHSRYQNMVVLVLVLKVTRLFGNDDCNNSDLVLMTELKYTYRLQTS